MNPLDRYKPSKNFQPSLRRPHDDGGARVVSILHNAVHPVIPGQNKRKLSAEDWLQEFDRDRWSAHFSARMEIGSLRRFSTRLAIGVKRFVSIDRIHKCLGGKEYACFLLPGAHGLHWFRSPFRELINAGQSGARPRFASDAAAKSLVAAGADVHRGFARRSAKAFAAAAAAADGVIHTAFIHDLLKLWGPAAEADRRAIEDSRRRARGL